jgi:hypothetical protein
MKIRLIDDVHQVLTFYSFWAFVAIFSCATLEAAAPLLQPWVPVWVYPPVLGVLAVVGALVRCIKQKPPGV